MIGSVLRIIVAVTGLAVVSASFALEPIPIDAETAFDSVTRGIMPGSGEQPGTTRVALIDIRDPVEYYFSGAAARVMELILKDREGNEITIDPVGKTRLLYGGKVLEYQVAGMARWTLVSMVSKLVTAPIADNVPFWLRASDGKGWADTATTEAAFYDAIDDYMSGFDVVILYCRTGGRSTLAARGILDRYPEREGDVYEIDDPSGLNLFGGFSGSTYANAYNGHPGFPGRFSMNREPPSASWLDSGLPVTTAFKPRLPE